MLSKAENLILQNGHHETGSLVAHWDMQWVGTLMEPRQGWYPHNFVGHGCIIVIVAPYHGMPSLLGCKIVSTQWSSWHWVTGTDSTTDHLVSVTLWMVMLLPVTATSIVEAVALMLEHGAYDSWDWVHKLPRWEISSVIAHKLGEHLHKIFHLDAQPCAAKGPL